MALGIVRSLGGAAVAIVMAYFGPLTLGHEFRSAGMAAFATRLLGHVVLALTIKEERTSLLARGCWRAGLERDGWGERSRWW